MALEGWQLGQYRLLRLLGSGGMGEVYLAEDARIGQQVAVKVNRTEATPYPRDTSLQDAVRLFQREARAVARLDHPYILPLFSYGEEQIQGMTLMYLVMPYRPEGTFANWLQQRGDKDALSVQDMAYLMSMAADALEYAHRHQIVHQDVKPSNFLIRTNQVPTKLPDLLLTDFGIARLSTATSRISHTLRGTPLYMAPEQWNSEAVPATDQYALAVLTYELLAGRPPFVGQQQQVMYQHFHVQPQPPSTLNVHLSQMVDAVILKALAKQPEDRFPSIAAFAEAFKQATAHLEASTIIKLPATPKSPELHVTLAISKAEAELGTNRTLTLPDGHRIAVSVPAGAYHGQVLRLPGMGEAFSNGEAAGTLILLLSVQETEGIAFPVQQRDFDRTALVSAPNTPDQTVLSANRGYVPSPRSPAALAPQAPELHHPQPTVRQQGISTGTAILLVGLALLLLVGGLGFFYLTTLNRANPTPINSATSTPTGGTTSKVTTTPASTQPSTPTLAVSPTSSGHVQLKSYYSGTATGYANAAVTFTEPAAGYPWLGTRGGMRRSFFGAGMVGNTSSTPAS